MPGHLVCKGPTIDGQAARPLYQSFGATNPDKFYEGGRARFPLSENPDSRDLSPTDYASKANLVHSEGSRVYKGARRGDQNENAGWNAIDKPRLRLVIETGPPKFRRQC